MTGRTVTLHTGTPTRDNAAASAEVADDGTVTFQIPDTPPAPAGPSMPWPDDAPDCAACGCPAAAHCRVCGCLTDKGTREECLCARYVADIIKCPDCGQMFARRWMLDNHRLPEPSCQTGMRRAAGRYAERLSTDGPPLRDHRDRYMKG